MLPPALLYGFGAVLMILGGLRAYHLGWKKKLEEQAEAAARAASSEAADDEGAALAGDEDRGDAGWRRRDGGGYKRHLVWGVLWIGIGLFLIVSTFMQRGR